MNEQERPENPVEESNPEETLKNLEKLLTLKEEEIKRKDEEAEELKKAIFENKTQIEKLEGEKAENEERIEALNEAVKESVKAYKSLVISNSPEIPEELITGESIDEVIKSLACARKLIKKVKENLKRETLRSSAPAGAPPRAKPSFRGLSSKEKIKFAIGGN